MSLAPSQDKSLPASLEPLRDWHQRDRTALPNGMKESVYDGNLELDAIREWATQEGTRDSEVVHVDMRGPRADRMGQKAFLPTINLLLRRAMQYLKVVVFRLSDTAVESLHNQMATKAATALKPGAVYIYPADPLVPPAPRAAFAADMYFRKDEGQGTPHVPFAYGNIEGDWWDTLGVLPVHPQVESRWHIPDVTTPLLHTATGPWVRGASHGPPYVTLDPPIFDYVLPPLGAHSRANLEKLGYCVLPKAAPKAQCERVAKLAYTEIATALSDSFQPIPNEARLDVHLARPELPRRYQSKKGLVWFTKAHKKELVNHYRSCELLTGYMDHEGSLLYAPPGIPTQIAHRDAPALPDRLPGDGRKAQFSSFLALSSDCELAIHPGTHNGEHVKACEG